MSRTSSRSRKLMAQGRIRGRNLEIWTWAILLLLSIAAAAAAADRRMLAIVDRISTTDLQNRQSLERTIQLAAFQQFDHHKTGKLYNVSLNSSQVSGGSIFQAIRLRVGSFGRYGVGSINEFSIPPGCRLNSTPQRILLVYAKLINTSLFAGLPDDRAVASSVVSIFAYDASNLNSTQLLNRLSITTTTAPVSIRIQPLSPGSSNISCASFDDNSPSVNYSALVQDACQVNHLGAFALVGNAPNSPPSPQPSRESSNTWKIAVGSVIGGLALLALLSLLAFALHKHRKNAKFATMEHQAGQGETLQTTSIRNSRAPAAGTTRTQPALENEYAI